MKIATLIALAAAMPAAALAQAQYKVQMNAIDIRGVGASLGTITIIEGTPGGTVVLKPDLKGLPPGPHGFHLHEFANCGAKEKDGKMSPGEMAGGHWGEKCSDEFGEMARGWLQRDEIGEVHGLVLKMR